MRYQIQQRLIAIGDDFWITDDDGDRAFRVDGKALRLRKTLLLHNRSGRTVCKVQKRVLRMHDTMVIDDGHGQRLARVQKALIRPFRNRWKVDLGRRGSWKVRGNILDHEYVVKADDREIAQISKRWFRIRDTYGVETACPPADRALVLAIVVAVDAMAHED